MGIVSWLQENACLDANLGPFLLIHKNRFSIPLFS